MKEKYILKIPDIKYTRTLPTEDFKGSKDNAVIILAEALHLALNCENPDALVDILYYSSDAMREVGRVTLIRLSEVNP